MMLILTNSEGSAHLNKGNYSDAITDFNKVISLKAGSAYPYELRGSAYLGMGDYSNAITDFNKVISLDPNNAAAFLIRATQRRQAEILRAQLLLTSPMPSNFNRPSANNHELNVRS